MAMKFSNNRNNTTISLCIFLLLSFIFLINNVNTTKLSSSSSSKSEKTSSSSSISSADNNNQKQKIVLIHDSESNDANVESSSRSSLLMPYDRYSSSPLSTAIYYESFTNNYKQLVKENPTLLVRTIDGTFYLILFDYNTRKFLPIWSTNLGEMIRANLEDNRVKN